MAVGPAIRARVSVDIAPLRRVATEGLREEFRRTNRTLRGVDDWGDALRRIRRQKPATWSPRGGRRRLLQRIIGRTDKWHVQTFTRRMRRFGFGRSEPLHAAEIGNLAGRIDGHFQTVPRRFEQVLARRLARRAKRGGPFSEAALRREIAAAQRTARYFIRRIATDQGYDVVADLNRRRQREMGVEEYEWETAGDDRVRPTHAANNGRRFRWDDAPGATGHPGSEVNCRCAALPVVDMRRRRQ